MKLTFFFLALSLSSLISYSQDTFKEDLAIVQAMFGKEKTELVKQYMALPAETDAAFWTVYDKYEASRKALGAQKAQLVKEYADGYANLDDKKASELMSKKLKMNDEYNKLQKTYFGNFSKVIGGRQAAKFMQLEDYLENNIRLFIQENIPFIDELDKTKIEGIKK